MKIPTYENIYAIGPEDIQGLIDAEVAESEVLDFKGETYKPHGGMREFCKDISAMANARGGVIVLGVTEDKEKGTALEVAGLNRSPSEIIEGLEQSAQANIRERILLRTHFIEMPTGQNIVLAATRRSTIGPHMNTAAGDNRIYKRAGRVTAEMDIHEIRKSILLSESASDVALAEHRKHVQIATSRSSSEEYIIVLDSFLSPGLGEVVDTSSTANQNEFSQRLNFWGAHSYRLVHDGWFCARDSDKAKAHISRRGTITAHQRETLGPRLAWASANHQRLIPANALIRRVWNAVEKMLDCYEWLNASPPYYFCLTIACCQDKSVVEGGGSERIITVPQLELPVQVVENVSELTAESVIELWMHRLWNASGVARCPAFDEESGTLDLTKL